MNTTILYVLLVCLVVLCYFVITNFIVLLRLIYDTSPPYVIDAGISRIDSISISSPPSYHEACQEQYDLRSNSLPKYKDLFEV